LSRPPEDIEAWPFDPSGEGVARRHFEVARDLKTRLDRYLQNRLKGISRSKIQKLIACGAATVNGAPAKASHKLLEGDRVEVLLPPPAIPGITPEPIPLSILYEDEDFIVVNKQADLIVHPARGHLSGTLVNGLLWHFQREAAQEAGLSRVGLAEQRPGVVHRLDRYTTGVMVVAKRDATHWAIASQFENRQVLKAYLAVVHGNPDPAGGVIEAPIGPHPTMREAYAVRHDPRAKPSVTLYRVREQYAGYALVELELKTGRTHQIRVHLSWLGHPIAGDIMYGGEPIGEREIRQPPRPAGARRMLSFARSRAEGTRIEGQAAAREDLVIATPALHAALLRIRHPRTDEPVTFQASLHEPMATLVRRLRERPAAGPVVDRGWWVDPARILGQR